ncbi:sterol desaturase family protein [Acidovorax lacteus]|uniref:Sterol desaturase family protein n=1 Tax=Acidovorax lacteus TaxID=1924988 RepID=A0ABP8LDH5_9BURK
MLEWMAQHAALWPAALLLVWGGLLALAEARWPRRPGTAQVRTRWPVNLGLYAAGAAVLASGLLQPLEQAALQLGSRLGAHGIAGLPWPDTAKIALGVLAIDAVQYLLHRLSHAVPLLWRLHQVHHADIAMDVSTSVRHHPLEVAVLLLLTLVACAALGVPVVSLLLYLALQVTHTVFCHANLALPPRLDAALRWIFVTPDMHRIHHSRIEAEGQRNFGMVLPWWDWLLRSYQAQPRTPHERMGLGLDDADPTRDLGWWGSLALPLKRLGSAADTARAPKHKPD